MRSCQRGVLREPPAREVAGAVNARDSAAAGEAGRAPPRGGSARPASAGDGWLPFAVAVVVAVVVPVAEVVPGAVPVTVVTVLPVAEFGSAAVVVARITA